jgi:hypothetical protein
MEELPSAANAPAESPAENVFGVWGRWWIRVLLFLAHLALLLWAASLTPDGYFFQLGEIAGMVMFFGSLCLWFFLWFVRKRSTVLLFCALAVAQSGLVAVIGLQFRKEDRALQGVMADLDQRQKTGETQMASFHVERVMEMLAPGNEFHREELPGLRERAHAATIANTEYWAQFKASVNDAEKRLGAVSLKAASDFRRGFESNSARNERIQELNTDYLSEIEKLTTLLIDAQGHYHSTKSGLAFERKRDLDTFNQILDNLNTIRTKLTELRPQPQQQ